MRIRSTGLTLFAGLSILVAACSSGTASTAPSAAAPSTAPTTAASAPASTAPSEAPSIKPTSDLKIGVVTDVGAVNDKNFNQFSYAGAVNGAVSIGAKTPSVVVPKATSDYEPLIQAYVDQGFNVIVGVGFNLANPTAKAAKASPDIWFIGVDHDPCINAKGDVDTTFADCTGVIADLIPNYIALNYKEDQAGYLAGIVAASATKSGIIGAIGGVAVCAPCVRYIQGYALGAKSVKPDIQVKVAWVTASDFPKGFFDQAGGKTFGDQFIAQNAGIDVIFQVAGNTGNGVIDAACGAGINAIGVDVDQYQSYAASQACILTSAEKHLAVSVSTSIQQISAKTAKGGKVLYDAANDGIGVAPFYEAASKLPADIQTQLDTALAGMKDGSVVTCPPAPACGKTPAPDPIVPAS
jgi:basic membrane lipoprotein Med (substrate-binding protein (PBP1-ABC) superfamily)